MNLKALSGVCYLFLGFWCVLQKRAAVDGEPNNGDSSQTADCVWTWRLLYTSRVWPFTVLPGSVYLHVGVAGQWCHSIRDCYWQEPAQTHVCNGVPPASLWSFGVHSCAAWSHDALLDGAEEDCIHPSHCPGLFCAHIWASSAGYSGCDGLRQVIKLSAQRKNQRKKKIKLSFLMLLSLEWMFECNW